MYYVPQDQVDLIVEGLLQPAAFVEFAGTTQPAGKARGGDYILVWLPYQIGYSGFFQISGAPEVMTAGQTVQLKLCKVSTQEQILLLRCAEVPCKHSSERYPCVQAFAPVKSKTILELRGLAFNPTMFTVGFGKLVADMDDCKKGNKYKYDPDSILAVITHMWNQAEAAGPFLR